MRTFKHVVALFLVASVLGAGCDLPERVDTKSTSKAKQIADRSGFGKLPDLSGYGNLGASEALSSRRAAGTGVSAPFPAPATPPAAADAISVNLLAPDAPVTNTVTSKLLPPMPGRIALVNYELKAELPEWPSEGAVFKAEARMPDTGTVKSFAASSGLPGQVVAGVQQVAALQAAWRDSQDFQWNYDLPGQNLNWWKNSSVAVPTIRQPQKKEPPNVDKARLLKVAQDFLSSHGLGAYALNGIVDEQILLPLMDATKRAEYSQPCIMREPAGVSGAAGSASASGIELDVEPAIYPSPCDQWWPTQAGVYFQEQREGKGVVEDGGYPARLANVSIDLYTYEVMGGNVLMQPELTSSLYPLMDKETAQKRLQAGGRNPVYAWGSEGGDVKVEIEKVEFGWMRHVAWTPDSKTETYYLPALLVNGKVDRKIAGQAPEVYYTVVPLVADDAFQDQGAIPSPVPLPTEPRILDLPTIEPAKIQ